MPRTIDSEPDPRTGREGQRWIPDNPDGSGWADVDWGSVIRGTRYAYRHGAPLERALAARPPWYLVRTRLESEALEAHENDYYVPAERLGDFLAEMALQGGAEVIWHIAPCEEPPSESRVAALSESPAGDLPR